MVDLNEVLVLGIQGRHSEHDCPDAVHAPQPVRRARFDVDYHAGRDVHDIVGQFHLATTLKNVVHLSAPFVKVLDGIGYEGDVKVADGGIGSGERAGALTAR